MKKAILVLGWTLLAVTVVLPLGTGLSAFFGYSFELTDHTVFALITMLLSIATVIMCIATKDPVDNRPIAIAFSLLTPLSLANAFFYMLEYVTGWVWISVMMLVSSGCCCYLTIRLGKPFVLKTASLVLSAITVLPLCYFGIIALVLSLIFGNIGINTVVQTVDSPNGKYYAEVVDSDQGALGGDTIVYVCDKRELNAVIFKISKKKTQIYHGEWGEAFDMEIYWKSGECLVIDSREFIVE